jgi:hypothetical protein
LDLKVQNSDQSSSLQERLNCNNDYFLGMSFLQIQHDQISMRLLLKVSIATLIKWGDEKNLSSN